MNEQPMEQSQYNNLAYEVRMREKPRPNSVPTEAPKIDMKQWISVEEGLEHQLTMNDLKVMQWRIEGNEVDMDYLLSNIKELKPDIFGLTLFDHFFNIDELDQKFQEIGYALDVEPGDSSSEFT